MVVLQKTADGFGRIAFMIRKTWRQRLCRKKDHPANGPKVTVVTDADLQTILGEDWRARLRAK